jgi:hypothetical protein
MSWSTKGLPLKLAVLAAAAAGAALLISARRRGEVWHTLADQDNGAGP